MSVLKITEEASVGAEAKNKVVAGQVRASEDGRTVILIVDAKHSGISLNNDEQFISIRLKGFDINETYGGSSARDIQRHFPVLHDAELTYSEAK